MFDRVLIGVDPARHGRDPIALARRLASPSCAFTLAHVYPGDARTRRGVWSEYAAGYSRRAHELLQRVRDEAGIEAQLIAIESASVGGGLHALAKSIGADLVVVGSSVRGPAGRVLLGDDTHDTLDRASCAVAVAPAGYAAHPHLLRRVGVAYNESPDAERALAFARAVAETHHARLSAIEVVSLPSTAFLAGPAPYDDLYDDLVKAADERLKALGDVDAHAVYGSPAETLAGWSGALDLLIIGSRGYGPVGRLVHGSTSQRLAHAAHCPLLVLTRAGDGVTDDPAAGHHDVGAPSVAATPRH